MAAVTCMSVLTIGQERDRAKVADEYKWNLADIYPDAAAWRKQKETVTGEIPKLREFRGKLGASPQSLASALELATRLNKELTRLYVYASMLADTDTRISEPQGMQQEMQQLYATFGAEAASQAALRLELMGRSGNLEEVEEAWQQVRTTIERLKKAVTEFRP